MSVMDRSGKWWAVLNTVTNIQITNKIFLREAINFLKSRSRTKSPCITKCVPLQLCSLLLHRKFVRYVNDLLFYFLFFSISSSLIDFVFFSSQYSWRNN